MLIVPAGSAAAEPLTLAEVKKHLRILHTSEDDILPGFIAAARAMVEHGTGRQIITRSWRLHLPRFPSSSVIVLPRPPLQSVTLVTYVDRDGASQTLDESGYVVVTEDALGIGAIELADGAAWPMTDKQPRAVTIEFVAGYGSTLGTEQADIRNALLLLVGHLYRNRESHAEQRIEEVPMAYRALLDPYRVHGWI